MTLRFVLTDGTSFELELDDEKCELLELYATRSGITIDEAVKDAIEVGLEEVDRFLWDVK